MNLVESYLSKNNFVPKIKTPPSSKVETIIVIPCFNEPCLTDTLQSLSNCVPTTSDVEVIIVINHSENALPEIIAQNEVTLKESSFWINQHNNQQIKFHTIYVTDQPAKHAGVGLARKTGMDEAVYRFNLINKPYGIIAGFDADTQCDPNYLAEIETHFLQNTKTPGASIYFEHPLEAVSADTYLQEGIIQYELHLRYLNQGLRYIGHPHAYHTVGSSFAVRTEAYAKQGGMNQRQAGEDFYFIQKIISLGNYSEINSTRVLPSPRVSDRVPFGTGAALKKWIEANENVFTTYNTDAFDALKIFFQNMENFYLAPSSDYSKIISVLHPALIDFLIQCNYVQEISQIKQNTKSLISFTNRFFHWFNVFKVIKFLNTSHIQFYKMRNVMDAAQILIQTIQPNQSKVSDKKEMLFLYRKLERKGTGGY